MITSETRMLLSRQVYRTSLRRLSKDVTCCSDTWPDWTPPLQRTRSWSKLLLSSPDTSPTLSGGELLDILVTLGSCRLAMDHHWVSDGSGRRHRITVIMESRRNGPQLSSRHDDGPVLSSEFPITFSPPLLRFCLISVYCILLCFSAGICVLYPILLTLCTRYCVAHFWTRLV